MNTEKFTPLLKAIDSTNTQDNLYELLQTEDINEPSYDNETFPYLYALEKYQGLGSDFRDNPKLDVNNKNKHNETALIFLAKANNHDDVKILLERGADYSVVDRYGKTAIDYAEPFFYEDDGDGRTYLLLKEWIKNHPIVM